MLSQSAPSDVATVVDDPAVALRSQLAAMRAAFAANPPGYERRMEALDQLGAELYRRQKDFIQAVSDDFGGRAGEETRLIELFPLISQVAHIRRHLKDWVRPRRRHSGWYMFPSTTEIRYQPIGVVGVIGTWNYPLLLSLSPLIDAVGAGNHVMVKPPDLVPRTSALLAEVISTLFRSDYVAVVTGSSKVARAFATMPFDHLIFTGSARVGSAIMKSAAENLTPVTLELGGKSPAIIHDSYSLPRAAARILTTKLLNAGQTCVAPDYVLLPEKLEDEFERLARATVAGAYPRLVDNENYTRIVDQKQYARLVAAVADAQALGARVVSINPAGEACTVENRVFAPTLVFSPTDGMTVTREEIFGPVLPVVPYRTLDEAIAYVNARPRPLAFYYFDENDDRIDEVLQRTTAGGVTINDCMYHLAQHDLPFGGIGPSGMGRYHGFDGFETFSNKKAVMRQKRWSTTSLLKPPYTARTRTLLDWLLRLSRR